MRRGKRERWVSRVLSDLPTLALIGERYLDTQHDAEHIAALEAELRRRGMVGLRRAMLEYLAASSLWWNILWWEWGALGGRDIAFGWVLNAVAFALIGGLIGLLAGPTAAIIGLLLVHGVTLWLGLSLRKGTKAKARPRET
jgi:hypothetical protein